MTLTHDPNDQQTMGQSISKSVFESYESGSLVDEIRFHDDSSGKKSLTQRRLFPFEISLIMERYHGIRHILFRQLTNTHQSDILFRRVSLMVQLKHKNWNTTNNAILSLSLSRQNFFF